MFSSLRRFDIVPVLLRQRSLTLEDNHFTTWSIMRRHNLLLSGWPFKLETVKLRQLTDWLTDWLLLILHRVIGLTDWVGGEPNSPVCLLARLCRYETLLFLQWRRRGGRSGGKGTGERLEKYWREREREEREECWGGVAAGVDIIAGHSHRAHQTPSPPYWLRQAVSSPSHSSDSGSDCTEILWR